MLDFVASEDAHLDGHGHGFLPFDCNSSTAGWIPLLAEYSIGWRVGKVRMRQVVMISTVTDRHLPGLILSALRAID